MQLTFTLTGTGWKRFQQRIAAMQIGLADAKRTTWLVGSPLPYSSHWIEEGWRDDPRRGYMEVRYRSPAATDYMQRAAQRFGSGDVRVRRPTETFVGAVFDGQTLYQYSTQIADLMRDELDRQVYSHPIPAQRSGRPQWTRSRDLYNSIQVRRG